MTTTSLLSRLGARRLSIRRAAMGVLAFVVRLTAPFAWGTRRRAATKLFGFAAAEAGSAKDMLRAAMLDEDAARRRLFFVHALDELRHADLFAHAARGLGCTGNTNAREEGARVAAARMGDLYRTRGLAGFLAFVEDAEERGQAHFEALSAHFGDAHTKTAALDDDERASLMALFARVAHEERFHVAYSGRLLARAHHARGSAIGARARALGHAWQRSGRALTDRLVDVLLTLFVLVVFPLFALAFVKERRLTATLVPHVPPQRGDRALDVERAALRSQL